MYLNVILLPLLNVLSTLAFGRYLGRKGSILIAITNLTTAWTLVCEDNLLLYSICLLFVHSWSSFGLFTISFELLFDNLSIIKFLGQLFIINILGQLFIINILGSNLFLYNLICV